MFGSTTFVWNELEWVCTSVDTRINTKPVYSVYSQYAVGYRDYRMPFSCAFCGDAHNSATKITIHAERPGAKLELELCGQYCTIRVYQAAAEIAAAQIALIRESSGCSEEPEPSPTP